MGDTLHTQYLYTLSMVCCSLYVVGVHSVAYAFPKVHLVTTAVDPEINDQFYILPGIGELRHHRIRLIILSKVI